MKKQLLFTALALAAAFTGCSDEEYTPQSGENRVQLFIDGPATRVVTDGNATSFEAGDQIAINSDGLAPEMENETFTVGEDGTLEANLSYYYDGNKSAKFYAYYPTTATSSEGNVSITVPNIQNGTDTYNAYDFMTSTATGSANTEDGAVSLKFAHRLSLVKVIWEGSTTATDIEMVSIKPTVTWTYATDALTTSGTATNIVMWKIAADKQEYWALIPAQTIAKGTKLLEIRDGDKAYPFIPKDDLAFNDKHVRKITLNTKEENGAIEVVATSISIDKWTDDEAVSEGELVSTVLPQNILINADQGTFKDVTALTALTKKTTQAGVWGFDADTEDGAKIELVTCPADPNAKAIHINVPQYKKELNAEGKQVETKWWENALYYQMGDDVARAIKPGKLYKLTFQLRSNSLDKKQLRMNVMQADLDNQFFPTAQEGQIKVNDVNMVYKDQELGDYYESTDSKGKPVNKYYWLGTQYPFVSPAMDGETAVENTAYEKKTYYVNFAKITTAGTGATYRDTPCSIADFGHVALCFAVNSGFGVDFYIKDITLEEYIPEE